MYSIVLYNHVKSTHRMGTPIHGEVDPTVKKQPCLSKHDAHTTKRTSMRNQKTFRFLWGPYRFSRFHATANIRCTLQYILNQRKFWRNPICIYIYNYIYIYMLTRQWSKTTPKCAQLKLCGAPARVSLVVSGLMRTVNSQQSYFSYSNNAKSAFE